MSKHAVKKQFNIIKSPGFVYDITIFHDGVKQSQLHITDYFDYEKTIHKLREEGYTKGYLPLEVEYAKCEYYLRRNRMIDVKWLK